MLVAACRRWASGAHDGIHVGDGDENLDPAIGQPVSDGELVEIHRRIVVDGAPQQLAQVADGLAGGLGRPLNALQMPQSIFGKVRLKAAFEHGLPGNGAKVSHG